MRPVIAKEGSSRSRRQLVGRKKGRVDFLREARFANPCDGGRDGGDLGAAGPVGAFGRGQPAEEPFQRLVWIRLLALGDAFEQPAERILRSAAGGAQALKQVGGATSPEEVAERVLAPQQVLESSQVARRRI